MSDAWDAYLSAEIRIELPAGLVLITPAPPLHAEGAYPDPDGRPIAVITAANPGGRPADPRANAEAAERLHAELAARHLTWWPAAGADPSWTHVEDSVAIPGISQQDALDLGKAFGQEAIFVLTPASRKVIDCVTGRMSMTGWAAGPDRWGEYLAAASRRPGLLCAVLTDDAAITLRGDGHGGVIIKGAAPTESHFPNVTSALHHLSHLGAFDSGVEFACGNWDAGDVAAIFARFLEDSEFLVDGGAWFSDGENAYPASATGWESLVLAESRWDLGADDDAHATAGSGESGGDFLLRVGPRYVIFQTNGAEFECDDLAAADDAAALEEFRDFTGFL